MRVGNRIFIVLLAFLVVFAAMPVSTYAAGKIDPEQDVALTISYKDGDKAISDAEFHLYKVMDTDDFARMSLTADFETYGSTLGLTDLEGMTQSRWLEIAATLKGYVCADALEPDYSGTTDENGALTLAVKPGLYLVIGFRTTTDDYYTYTATPYMLFLPASDTANNDWEYTVTTLPKFGKEFFPPEEPDPVITRKVLVQWDDAGYETVRPEEVVIRLLCGGEEYTSVTLTESDSWRCAWDNLDAQQEWTVIEDALPGYVITIVRNGITFTVTNKYVVPVSTEGDPPVQKRITGDVPANADTFTFCLTAQDPAFPMPEGSSGSVKTMSVQGAGSVEFGNITFSAPGVYAYTISEKNTGVEGYTYDNTVFTVTYVVTLEENELKVQRTIADASSDDVAEVVFTNNYKTPEPTLPQTGVLWWPVPVLFFLGMILVMVGTVRRRRSE